MYKGGGNMGKKKASGAKRMTKRQKAFADEWLKTGNAYASSVKAGYSPAYAKGHSHKLVDNIVVKSYLSERMKKIDDKVIADQQEVLETITRIVRGQEEGIALIGTGHGKQEAREVKPTVNEKLKASEMLGKLYSLWTDKVEIEDVTPTIVDDIDKND